MSGEILVEGTEEVERTLKETCLGIGERYEIHFIERDISKKPGGEKGSLWRSDMDDRFYINTVGAYAKEDVIRTYVEQQGKQYRRIYSEQISFLNDLF